MNTFTLATFIIIIFVVAVVVIVIGLEVNADKTKYIVMSRDQNAGRSHGMKTDNSCFERVEEFKYLEQL